MRIATLNGEIEILSGLHIGGGDDTMKIGGVDNQVIKDVNTNKPYIPGSSFKGKMRSLLEWDIGVVGIGDGGPFHSKLLKNVKFKNQEDEAKALNLLKVFGNGKSDDSFQEITRITVGDCALLEVEDQKYTEAKYENSIDRQKGTASNPRQTERVPAGVKFSYSIKLKIIDEKNDNESGFKAMVARGLELIENDYLGGSGSRGYGRVRFSNKTDWIE